MDRFRLAHAVGGSAIDLADHCIAALGVLPDTTNLGFVYATDAVAAEFSQVVARLRAGTPVDQWFGTVGIGISATGCEYYDRPALAVLVASLPDAAFRALPAQWSNPEPFLTEAREWLAQDEFHFGILHGDPAGATTPTIISELAAGIPGAFFVGGLTASQSRPVQVAGEVSAGGVSGVVFSSDVAVVTSHTQGCTPIADKHTVTACDRNIVIELDGRPALDVFKEDVGEVIARDLARAGGYIFAALPIPGSDTGDYLVRNLVGIDPEHKLLAIADHAHEGGELLFCRRDGNSARDDLKRMLADLRQRMGATPCGALYHSCLARGRHQFGENSAELRIIAAELGELPLIGFFANGEIFHNRLYAYTGVLTIFC